MNWLKNQGAEMQKAFQLSFSLLVAILIGCQPTEDSMLKPDDEIGGMIITTGAFNSPPLGAFCVAALKDGHATSVDCQVPPVSRLAIGHTLGVADPALQTLDWSALDWELNLDGHRLDLKAFGLYQYVLPDLAPSPSLTREVLRQVKAWDVILINPTPGTHTLSGKAYDEADTYIWTVNFTVEASYGP